MRQSLSFPSFPFRLRIVTAVFTGVMMLSLGAVAQTPVSLQEQLSAQYKLVRMGSDSSGLSVVEAGTLLAIQKGGILGVPYSDQSIPASTYQNGTLHSPSVAKTKALGFAMKSLGKGDQTTQFFKVGNKAYPSKITVDPAKDSVSMNIVACDTCNKTDPPTYIKATVVFQFAKGSLATVSAGAVEDTIGQVFTITSDDEGAQQDQGGQQGQGQQQGGQPAAQPPPAQPQTIQLGMTTDQVQAALGNPDKIVNLGPKQLYIYKDMKVTFLNGKVSDVQ
jgi:hypothetical protein